MTTGHRISIGIALALALALGTGAAPASARPFDLNANGSYVPAGTTSTQTSTQTAEPPPSIVRVTAPNNGFDWGDAGIGAAGGIALSIMGVGGALAVSQNRARRTRHSTALTS